MARHTYYRKPMSRRRIKRQLERMRFSFGQFVEAARLAAEAWGQFGQVCYKLALVFRDFRPAGHSPSDTNHRPS